MIRGCKKAGACEELEAMERTNIYFKVLGCGECNERLCNKSPKQLAALSIITIFTISCVHLYAQNFI